MMLSSSHLASPLVQRCSARKPAPFAGRPLLRPLKFDAKPQVFCSAAADDADAELEKRLEKLRKAKGATPYGQGVKAAVRSPEEEIAPKKSGFDYSGEVVYSEGPPSRGDLALNIMLAGTVLWLPLTIAAVGRALCLNYRFTDKRISITTTTPLKVETIDVAYQNVKDCITIGRFFGAWGDILITLRDNTKIELRSADKYQELRKYILERRDALAPASPLDEPGKAVTDSKRGFA